MKRVESVRTELIINVVDEDGQPSLGDDYEFLGPPPLLPQVGDRWQFRIDGESYSVKVLAIDVETIFQPDEVVTAIRLKAKFL